MSAQNPKTFVEWWKGLPIPWLASLVNGTAEANANGTFFDNQVALIKQATKAHMPGQAPSDALPVIGGDRQLEQGPLETNPNFIIRLQTAWDDWARAGTALELLVQLFWAGFPGAVLIQQNGLVFTLSGAPTAGVDPTSLLVTQSAMPNVNKTGSPPWWSFDGRDYFASRFTVLFPSSGTQAGGTQSYLMTSATATFVGTEDGSVGNPWPIAVWSNPFADTSYITQVGAVYAAGEMVTCSVDATTKTLTGVKVAASGPFVGTVDVLGWQAGQAWWADPHPADLARLRRIIARWKPAKATCTGIVVCGRLPVWGWPLTTKWGDAGLKWGVSNSVRFTA